ncbi:MAG TPA: BTAD domain-containing putative transcriptional regulator [Candidatus Sulfomarinibacteraceae bacterium]|nr:BTAD domain-containing putative transcriptional regulator [Candidatus Sulfomarinibacteraceae bacterium]
MDLLASGHYGEAVALLEDVEEPPDSEEDPALSTMLLAVRQMCLAGDNYQTEAELHRKAYHAATVREQQLRQQLQSLLALVAARIRIGGGESEDELRERREIPSILKRLQGLLGFNQQAPAEATGSGAPDAAIQEAAPPPPPDPAPAEAATVEERPKKEADPEEPTLAVYCLGSLRVYDNGRLVDEWTGNKSKTLFKYLVLHRERPVHRDVLIDMLWRDEDPEAARRNLYQAVYMLRQALQPSHPDFQYILCENSCYLFNPELDLWVDYEAFLKHYQAGQRLERENRLPAAILQYEAAENLYEGEFLAPDLYEEWTLMLRERLKHAYLDLLDRISRFYWSQNQYSLCIAYCQKILLADRCREDAHRRLMMAYMRQGHRHLALRQYHLCVEALKQELDTDPMPETRELYEEIKRNRTP